MTGKYDIIIIGAGPGGLACAHELGNSNSSVLVIEKNEIIGPKVCAGGLKNLDKDFKLPVDKIRTFLQEDYVTKYKSYTLNLEKPLRTISRYDLGQYQLKMLDGLDNIKIMTGVKVKEIKDSQIITSAGDFSFKYLIGADGSNSMVRRHLGLETKSCIGMYYEISGMTDTVIWHFNPEEIMAGYIWAFPHLNSTNMGIFFNPEHLSPKVAKKVLHDYLDDRNINYAGCKYQTAAISHHYDGCEFNNIFLVGDAAGLALRTNGAGISFAIVSGKEIARKILKPDYKMPELAVILNYKKRQENLFSFIERIPFIQRPAYRMMLNLMKKKWFQKRFGSYF
ncbi:MAG: FAD-dependent monooxygenase [Thermoplasmata archaeon]|nr:FAD-dependent monooxygenase [Thermoplasmata archaeon]